MAALMNISIIDRLRAARVPEYSAAQFAASQRIFPNSSRSTLTEGILATHQDGNVRVVVKSLNKAYAIGKLKEMNTEKYKNKLLAYFEREADIRLRARNHPNIAVVCGFMPSYGSDAFPVLIFPFFPLGDLRSYVEDQEVVKSDKSKLLLLRDVACGLEYLHNLQPPIVHRDLSASNVLLKATSLGLVACISDFGSAKLIDPALNVVCSSSKSCTYQWQPPEYVKPKTYLESYTNPKPSGDIWTFGCVVIEVLTEGDPWPLGVDVLRELSKDRHPPRPCEVEIKDEYWKFLGGCWKSRPSSRYTVEEVIVKLDRLIQADN